ncbi:MAG: ATP synthase subunit I [Lachnospiraceae bacterium]
MRKLRDINDSLPALFLGILAFGFLAEIIPIWFVDDKTGYTVGLLAGIATALFAAWHMAWTLDKAFGLDEGTATKQMQKNSALRYGVQLIVLGVLMITGIGNPLSAILGMIGLKVSAYLAPFTDKLFRR